MAVFPQIAGGTQPSAILNKELKEWKGIAVTLSIADAEAGSLNDGSFSIRKNAAPTLREEDSLLITAADSIGLLNGVYFLLRAQQQRDTCLCVTLPHYDIVRITPLFPRRVVVYDLSFIEKAEEDNLLTEMIRRDAMSGINGWIVEDGELHALNSEEKESLRQRLGRYGITLYNDRNSLGNSTFELTDEGNGKYMGEKWKKLMTDSCRKGDTTIIYRPENPSGEHPFREINQYLFGRLSSDANALPRRIAYEWIAKNYSDNPLTVRPLLESLLNEDEISFLHKIKRI